MPLTCCILPALLIPLPPPPSHNLSLSLLCYCRLIAATYTPMVAVPLVHDPLICRRLLVRVWMTALGGASKTWLWPNAPRFLSALTYVAMGWSALPYMPMLAAAVDSHVLLLVSTQQWHQ